MTTFRIPSPRTGRRHATRRNIAVAVAAVAALGLSASACSDNDDTADAATTAPTSASASDETTAGGVDPTHDHVVDVSAVDFAFEDLPDRIDAGTRLTLTNNAPRELHELVAFRLPDDEERPVSELLQLPQAELGEVLGEGPPATVLLTAPGEEQISAVGDGTLTEPGRYLVMCAIPTGVDPAEYLAAAAAAGGEQPDVAGGPPHFVSGMAAQLIVE